MSPSNTCARMGSASSGASLGCSGLGEESFMVRIVLQGKVLQLLKLLVRDAPEAEQGHDKDGKEGDEANNRQRSLPLFDNKTVEHKNYSWAAFARLDLTGGTASALPIFWR